MIGSKKISFYSLKGDTSKSLALVNTAYRMAQLGHRVLCLDMDIEAPGLLDLFGIDERDVKLSTKQLLEKRSGEKVSRILQNDTSSVIDIGEKYNDQTLEGKVFLIPALRERKSLNRIMQAADSKIKVQNVSKPNETIRDALIVLDSQLALDYILIDSRSGISKEAFYSLLLSDTIVLNTRLDKQERSGIEYVYGVLKDYFYEKAQIDSILIASNVPTDIPEEVDRIVKEIEDKIGDKFKVIIPHDSKLMLNGEIVVKTRPDSYVAKQFDELAKILTSED